MIRETRQLLNFDDGGGIFRAEQVAKLNMSASPKKTKKRNMDLERARRGIIRKAQAEPGVADVVQVFQRFNEAYSVMREADLAMRTPSFGTNSNAASS